MTSATASATAASRASAATTAETSCTLSTMPPIAASSERFSAVTSHVCTLPSCATNRSATDRASVPDGQRAHFVEPGRRPRRGRRARPSTGAHRARSLRVAEEGGSPRRRVHDRRRRRRRRTRDRSTGRSGSRTGRARCSSASWASTASVMSVATIAIDVAIDGDDVHVAPAGATARRLSAALGVDGACRSPAPARRGRSSA